MADQELFGAVLDAQVNGRTSTGFVRLDFRLSLANQSPEIGDSSLTLVLPPKTARNLAQELHKLLDQALWDDD